MARKLLIGLGAVLALVVAAAIAIPFLVPFEAYKPQVIARVKEATGRDLRIDGAMTLSLFPRVALELGDVGFSGLPGADGKQTEMVRLESLELVLALRPLFSGDLEVHSFVLTRPVIALETDSGGRGNWEPGGSAGDVPTKTAPGGDSYILKFSVDDARILDGTLTWRDRRSDTTQTFSGIDLQVALPGLNEPLQAEGKVEWKAEAITLDLELADIGALSDGKSSAVRADLRSNMANVVFDGTLRNAKALAADGPVDLTVPSLRSLLAWIGSPVAAPADTLEALRVQGKLSHEASRSSLTAAKVRLDDIEAAGTIGLDTGGKRPRLEGTLVVDRLDLDPYLAGDPKPSGTAAPAGRGWSDRKIDVRGLEAVDLDLDLSVATLHAAGVEITDCGLAARLKSGRLTADLSRFSVYEGKGHGKVVLDGEQTDGLSAAIAVDLENFDAEALLRDAAGSDRLSGTGVLDASIATRGRTERELMQSIQGKGRVDMRNGVIKGINLVAMVMHVASAFQAGDPSAKTDFSEMGGSFTINRGVLRNDDLSLKSPLIHVEGQGSVDLGRRTVDYRISPKVVTPLVGSLGLGTPGIMVPVLIRGPWSNIRYEPDLAGIIRQGFTAPGDAVEGVLKVPGVIFRGGRKVVDPDYDDDPPPGEGERKDDSIRGKATDAFKGLFGR